MSRLPADDPMTKYAERDEAAWAATTATPIRRDSRRFRLSRRKRAAAKVTTNTAANAIRSASPR